MRKSNIAFFKPTNAPKGLREVLVVPHVNKVFHATPLEYGHPSFVDNEVWRVGPDGQRFALPLLTEARHSPTFDDFAEACRAVREQYPEACMGTE